SPPSYGGMTVESEPPRERTRTSWHARAGGMLAKPSLLFGCERTHRVLARRWPRTRRASGRPRTDNLRFTKPALLPIEPRRQWQAPRELNPASRFWRPARQPWDIGACVLVRAPPLGKTK